MKNQYPYKNNFPYMNGTLCPEERAEDLLRRMKPEEKLGQIQCYSQIHTAGKNVKDVFPYGVGQVCGLIAVALPDKESAAGMIRKVQDEIMETGEHHIPAIFHIETLCGLLSAEAESFPSGIGQASTWNPELQKKVGHVIGEQSRVIGIRQALAPVLDISRDSRFGRQGESYGEDPVLTSAMGTAYVQGLQNDGNLTEGVAATAKHFLAFQAGEGGIHTARSAVPERELREVYAKPFQSAITEGKIQSIMNSYASVNGEPVAGSKKLLTDLLRGEMKFQGFTVSDYSSIKQLHTVHKTGESPEDVAQRALEAGMDAELPINENYTEDLLERIRYGKMSPDILDEAVRRILTVKFRLGLFENPYPEEEKLNQVFRSENASKIAAQAAEESIVLLKNDGILPLKTEGKKIAVIGYHAASTRALFGGYTYMAMKESSVGVKITMAGVEVEDDSPVASDTKEKSCYPGSWVSKEDRRVEGLVRKCYPGIQSILEELEKACHGSKITYSYGYPYAGDDESGFAEALEAAKAADLVVLTLGGRYGWNMASTTGEGIDAMHIGLPKCQERFLEELEKLNKRTVGIHFDGRPVSSDRADRLSALIEAWTPGEHGGKAIADILLGYHNPDGKLPVSVAREEGQIPVYYSHENGSGYNGGPSCGFEDYVDGYKTPRYYFGHGLSYTIFAVSSIVLNKTKVDPEDILTIRVSVKNTGNVAGAEVVQLYLKDIYASIVRPVMELEGFKKVYLEPGEEKNIIFQMPVEQCAFLDDTMKWKIEKGKMKLMVGVSSKDIRQETEFYILKDGYADGAQRSIYAKAYIESENGGSKK